MIRAFAFFKIGEISTVRQGLSTGDNDKYLRLWFEVSHPKIAFSKSSKEGVWKDNLRYVPLHKGGSYRKWFGNNEYILKFDEQSFHDLANSSNHLPSRHLYFQEGITWSNIAVKMTGFRKFGKGFVFTNKGACIFAPPELEMLILAFLNSVITIKLLQLISPSIGFEPGYISSLTLPEISESLSERVCNIATDSVRLAKCDWDAFETSWDFEKHPLL